MAVNKPSQEYIRCTLDQVQGYSPRMRLTRYVQLTRDAAVLYYVRLLLLGMADISCRPYTHHAIILPTMLGH